MSDNQNKIKKYIFKKFYSIPLHFMICSCFGISQDLELDSNNISNRQDFPSTLDFETVGEQSYLIKKHLEDSSDPQANKKYLKAILFQSKITIYYNTQYILMHTQEYRDFIQYVMDFCNENKSNLMLACERLQKLMLHIFQNELNEDRKKEILHCLQSTIEENITKTGRVSSDLIVFLAKILFEYFKQKKPYTLKLSENTLQYLSYISDFNNNQKIVASNMLAHCSQVQYSAELLFKLISEDGNYTNENIDTFKAFEERQQELFTSEKLIKDIIDLQIRPQAESSRSGNTHADPSQFQE